MNFETILVENPEQHVVLVTLNRPEARNAFNTRMAEELVALFEGFRLDPVEPRCIVLTGAGDRAFCAGGDLKERRGMSDDQWRRQHLVFERMARAVIFCPVPVIAAVNGAAFGGGCELAGACDFIYASQTARFALTEVTLGIIPGAGGTQTLPRAVGTRRAKEVIFTGEPFDAQAALEWGFANRVCAPDTLLPEAIATATRIAANAPISIRQAKQAIARGCEMSLADGLAFEIEAYNRTVPSADRQEGIEAFNEKRKPRFKGV
ncbi:enoyl CoA hydratase [Nitratireductor indicus C115]|uniref:Enoyl CoA hydratase n=1 Tax=Nitratireductor indicus C115 TaxID=1231190 RepID=K2PQ60_9HYPH|nr:enoyl-CoA hydratase-related protein [Nitratireductor indicus]EKF43182.1 enoyl CoA hydratase [Nitratireductor indicus C115]SFQ53466.1 Enoyl-CoA hydratase/carnithine racemase [Nitratireductor indicus]